MYEYRKSELLKYLQFYLSKKLRMEVVIRNIINRLKQNKRLTINQFNSIIKFIERENNFITMSRNQIFDYFDCLLERKRIYEPNTLCEFFVKT